jgi:uncharacterized protein YbjT (DUF2867 family)
LGRTYAAPEQRTPEQAKAIALYDALIGELFAVGQPLRKATNPRRSDETPLQAKKEKEKNYENRNYHRTQSAGSVINGDFMKILVTGGTGKVVREVQALLRRGESVRVLTRNKEAKLPDGAEVAVGDLLDPGLVHSALNGVEKLFLLVGNAADELTQALLTVAVARQAKVKHITYLSVYQVERFPDVPHFIGKYAVETSLKAFDTPFTVLRPGYFFQNDARLKPVLTGAGLYPVPIGKAGIAAIDVRDIADAAVVSLTTDGHAGKTYNLVAPDPLSGPGAAAIWSEVLNKQVRYADLPVEAFEEQLRQIFPAWHAMDLRLMFEGYQDCGFAPRTPMLLL